jgi:hypothetical protein
LENQILIQNLEKFVEIATLMLGFVGIMAAVFYSKKKSGNVEIVFAVIQNGWAVRVYDKDLLMIELVAVGEFEEELTERCGLKVRELWREKEKQMERNEEDLEVSIEIIIGRGERVEGN